jgi:hypothetical protein
MIASRLLEVYENWKTLDFIKIGVGSTMLIFGIYHLVKHKKTKS